MTGNELNILPLLGENKKRLPLFPGRQIFTFVNELKTKKEAGAVQLPPLYKVIDELFLIYILVYTNIVNIQRGWERGSTVRVSGPITSHGQVGNHIHGKLGNIGG